jgi:hypothetical protein
MFQGTRPRRAVSVGSTLPRSQTWSVSHNRDTTNGYSLRSRGTRLSSDPSLIATHFFAGSRADSPSLGLRKSGGPIVRHGPLGEYGPHRALGASRPPGPRPPSLGQPDVPGLRASHGVARGTGRGPAGGRGHALQGAVPALRQDWGPGAGERPHRLQGQRSPPGLGQLPRRARGRRRVPGQRGERESEDVDGRARHAPRRPRLAGVVLRRPRLQEDGAPPEGLPGEHACPGRPGGRRGHHDWGNRPRRGRGLRGQAEGDPPADEEEPAPEQAEAGAPETPGPVMPSAPLVQESRDVVERGRGSHGLCSSQGVGAYANGSLRGPVSPADDASLRTRRSLRPFLPQCRWGQRCRRLRQEDHGVLLTTYQPQASLSSLGARGPPDAQAREDRPRRGRAQGHRLSRSNGASTDVRASCVLERAVRRSPLERAAVVRVVAARRG